MQTPKTKEEIKSTISKLLALAGSPNKHEAKAALLKARSLMAKYKIQEKDVGQMQNLKVIRRLIGVLCTKMTNTWAVSLSGIIAEHYCCKAYRSRQPGAKKVEIGLIGLEDDFEICERVFKYAFDCVESHCKEIKFKYKGIEAAHIRQMTNAYGAGFCNGLLAAYAEQDKEHQEFGLVLVTPQAVVDTMQAMGKPTVYGKIDSSGWKSAFAAQGYKDGKKFDPTTKLPQAYLAALS